MDGISGNMPNRQKPLSPVDVIIVRLHTCGETILDLAARVAPMAGEMVKSPRFLGLLQKGSVLVPPPRLLPEEVKKGKGQLKPIPPLTSKGVAAIVCSRLAQMDYMAESAAGVGRIALDEASGPLRVTVLPHLPREARVPAQMIRQPLIAAGYGPGTDRRLERLDRIASNCEISRKTIERVITGKQSTVSFTNAEDILSAIGRADLARDLISVRDAWAAEVNQRLHRQAVLEEAVERALHAIALRELAMRPASSQEPLRRAALEDCMELHHIQNTRNFPSLVGRRRRELAAENFTEANGRPPTPVPPDLIVDAIGYLRNERKGDLISARNARRRLRHGGTKITANMVDKRLLKLRRDGVLPPGSRPKPFTPKV